MSEKNARVAGGSPVLLVGIELSAERRAMLESGYRLIMAPDRNSRQRAIAEHGGQITAVLTNGATGLDAAEFASLPGLGIVCCIGAGFERVDLAAARARGIPVVHGPGANDASVADHAMGLLIAAMRGIAPADRGVREGGWNALRTPRATPSGKRLGILGLGTIGLGIARRAAAFDMTIAYHNRRRRPDIGFDYLASPRSLAEWCDALMVVLPGGEATRHMVGAEVLAALGPRGWLVNVGRGSVVDSEALVDALEAGTIAGAALDVVEGEPDIPARLRGAPNLLLTPHIAGRSPEAMRATAQLVRDNLDAHFAGRPVLTPVPG